MMRPRRALAVLSALLSVFLSACARTAAPVRAEGAAESISVGVTHRTVVRSQPTPLVMHIVEIELEKAPGTLKVAANQSVPDGSLIATTVSQLAAKADFSVAVNANFFQVPGGRYPKEGDRTKAVGGLILEGRTISPKGPAHGLIDAGLCIEGRNVRVEKGFECRGATYGLASGPLLLWQGQSVDTDLADRIFRSPRHPRTAFGVDSARKKVWMIVADGRQEGVSEGATLDDLKEMLKRLGAVDALNLDGGGSSTLVARVNGTLRVLNVPVHERVPGRERPVVTALGMTNGE